MNTITEETEITQIFQRLKRTLLDNLYSELNAQQRNAIFNIKGPILVLAGAGTGKTTTLVNRIEYICSFGNLYNDESVPDNAAEWISKYKGLSECGKKDEIRAALKEIAADPCDTRKIVCITFTNKAASEFKSRLNVLLGDSAKNIWAGTFHSVCVRILRRHIDRLGFSNDFTIYDTDDSKKLIDSIIKRLEIDGVETKTAMNMISRAKDKALTATDFSEAASSDTEAEVSRVYNAYSESLKAANALDFDDIILYTLKLFETFADIRQKYNDQFDYILVDEFQDTNVAQGRLVNYFAGTKRNVCVVGDDDQSIYAFRGATIENILKFDDHFKDTVIIRLEQNYRSTGNILNAANAVIANNTGRKGKKLWTQAEQGERITLKRQSTQSDEAGFIVSYIKENVHNGNAKYSDFAILFRVSALSSSLEIIFSKSNVPYRVYGGTRFYDKLEIKDLVAYLSVINNTSDDVRLKRIINVPKRAIGNTTVALLEELAAQYGKPIFEIIASAEKYPQLSKALPKLAEFKTLIEYLQKFSQANSVSALVRELIVKTEYKQMILARAKEDGKEDVRERAELIDELVSAAIAFEERTESPSLKAFLEEVALVSDIDNYDMTADAVTLMTIHSAKGLEFDTVFLPGFEEGIFPTLKTLTSGSSAELEEERRLAYVAMTRAKKKLIILYTNTRLLYGTTSSNPLSRFGLEIPKEFVTIEQPMRTPYNSSVSESKRRYSNSRQSFLRNTGMLPDEPKKEKSKSAEIYNVGDRISHMLFGNGTILHSTDMSGDTMYEIEFDNGSTKKLMATYARLKKID